MQATMIAHKAAVESVKSEGEKARLLVLQELKLQHSQDIGKILLKIINLYISDYNSDFYGGFSSKSMRSQVTL